MKSKKDKIIDAAVDLFAEKGFSNTSTAEIATLSGVAQGTLFYHFTKKEGILYEVLDQILQHTTTGYKDICQHGKNGLECVEALLRSENLVVEQHSKKVTVLIRDMTDEVHHPGTKGFALIESFLKYKIDLLSQFIRKGIEDKSIRPVAVEETAWFLDAAHYGMMHIRLCKHLSTPPFDEHAIRFCIDGLKPNPNLT
jgi:AcrR family transcriptional regulator